MVNGASVVVVLTLLFTSASAIINGTRARAGQYPFMVSLQWDGRHKCGGTLLNRDTILTAAHCYMLVWVNSNEPHKVTALLGSESSLVDGVWPSQRVGIRRIILPNSLSPFNETKLRSSTYIYDDDYMLLKTNRSVQTTPTIKYAAISPRRDPKPGDNCTIIGWGRSKTPDIVSVRANVFPKNLRKGWVTVIRNKDCDLQRPRPYALCVAPTVINGQPRGIPCYGDSGSPLICTDRSGKHFVAGVALEAAVPCNYPEIPAVYLRSRSIRTWILKQLRKS